MLFYHTPFLWAHLPLLIFILLAVPRVMPEIYSLCNCLLELSFGKAFLKTILFSLQTPKMPAYGNEMLPPSLFMVISLEFWTTSILANWMAPGNVPGDRNLIACPVKWFLLWFWPQPAGTLPSASWTQFGNQHRQGPFPVSSLDVPTLFHRLGEFNSTDISKSVPKNDPRHM